jgi:hypothetical protein
MFGLGRKIIQTKKKEKHKSHDKILEDIISERGTVISNLSPYYIFFTSLFSRYEFVKEMKKYCDIQRSRMLYNMIREQFGISEILYNNKSFKNLFTPAFFECIIKEDIDIGDGIQIKTAANFTKNARGMLFVTGNTKHIAKMKKLYSEVISVKEAHERINLTLK